jgi:hypothetical protein
MVLCFCYPRITIKTFLHVVCKAEPKYFLFLQWLLLVKSKAIPLVPAISFAVPPPPCRALSGAFDSVLCIIFQDCALRAVVVYRDGIDNIKFQDQPRDFTNPQVLIQAFPIYPSVLTNSAFPAIYMCTL